MSKPDDFEMLFFEEIVTIRPNYVEALSALAEIYTARAFYEKGLALDKRLAELCPEDALVFYNLACSYALLQQTALALECLDTAVALGYDEWKYMQNDADLKSLASDPHFKRIIRMLQNSTSQSATSSI